MRVLIVEDDRASRQLLRLFLEQMGHEVVQAASGDEAWGIVQTPDAPRMLLIDRMMPGMDGVELCRRIRGRSDGGPFYIILVTALGMSADVVAGLDAGADDYIAKPFDQAVLGARLGAGIRILDLQGQLAGRVDELTGAIEHIRTLQGIIPICMHCKRIRDDEQSWRQIEEYISMHSEARFSHGLCPECEREHYPD